MDAKLTGKDRKVFGYVCDNFSCQICKNILIQCVTLSCSHNFCHYCMELYLGGKTHHPCPQCGLPIQHGHRNPNIDQKIDNLLSTCSEPVQQAYATALDLRFRKTMEWNKMRQNVDSKMAQNPNLFDEISGSLKLKNGNMDPDQCVVQALKSARRPGQLPIRTLQTQRKSSRNQKESSGLVSGRKSARTRSSVNSDTIDMDKVNVLFGIYDHVLKGDTGNANEPSREMAGGDFLREQELVQQEMENPPKVNLEGMQNFTKRNQLELESLIQEADNIIKLDGHVQKWTKKMKDALTETGTKDAPEETLSENKPHVVDDELWKASNELLERLQGIRNEGKTLAKSRSSCNIPTLPPLPRSLKLDIGSISDDSDVEEYEKALESLQICLDDSKTVTKEDAVPKLPIVEPETNSAELKEPPKESIPTDQAEKKKSILDCVEESGNDYVNENIKFITQVRKYKDALMKIHNREVESAQEIKELIPTQSFSLKDRPSANVLGEIDNASRAHLFPKHLQPSRHNSMSAMKPISRSRASTRLQPFTLSARLPPYVAPVPLARQFSINRPMTANSLEQSQSGLQPSHPHQRHSMGMMNQSSKTCSALRRGRASKNPLYTVR